MLPSDENEFIHPFSGTLGKYLEEHAVQISFTQLTSIVMVAEYYPGCVDGDLEGLARG